MQSSDRMLKSRKFWAGLLLSFVLIAAAIWFLDIESILKELSKISLSVIFICLGLAFLQQIVFALRWHALVKPLGMESFQLAFWSTRLNHFYNLYLPARLGEPYRLFFLYKRAQVKPSLSLGSLLGEKLLDLVALGLFAYFSFLGLKLQNDIRFDGLYRFGFIGLLLVLSLFLLIGFLSRLQTRFTFAKRIVHKLQYWRKQVWTGFAVLRHKKVLGLGLLMTALSWMLFASIIWLLIAEIHEPLSFSMSLLVLAGVSAAISLPAGPGNVGTFEAGAVLPLVLFAGLPTEKAVSIAISFHIVQSFPTFLIGLIGYFLFLTKSSISELSELQNLKGLEENPARNEIA